MLDYILTRSSRKTTAIHIRNGNVEVRAPLRKSKQDIDRFVLSKEQWIIKNIAKQKTQIKHQGSFRVDYGSHITWRGNPYPIVGRTGSKAGFDGDVFYMPQGLTPEKIKAVCIQVYRRLALTYFIGRVSYYSAQMGIAPAAVKINGAKTRWGSCSAKRSINFSWRLAMAEDCVIDYVVVHELAHLIEMNHSVRFWAVVASVLPDYINRKKGLKILQQRLANEDWG